MFEFIRRLFSSKHSAPPALALPDSQALRDALQNLKRIEARYRAAAEGMLDGFLILEAVRDADGEITDFRVVEANAAIQELYGVSREKIIGNLLSEVAPPELYRTVFFGQYVTVVNTREPFEADLKLSIVVTSTPTTKIPWVRVRVVPLDDGVMAISRDITEFKRAEEATARLNSVMASSSDAIVGKTPDGLIETWNAGAERLYAFTAEEVIGRPSSILVPPELQAEEKELLARVVRGERVGAFETVRLCKGGERLNVSMSASPIRDFSGETVGISTLARDVTEARRAERAIEASLREKDVLLKEIHHRVKNNLQVVSSLLGLQTDYVKDATALAVFAETQGRIRSIALLHEKLFQAKDLGSLAIDEYLHDLTATVLRNGGSPAAGIRCEVRTAGLRLELDEAVPCALIVNELLTNALKHAWPTDFPGEKRVCIEFRQEGDSLVLDVADNGAGYPPDLELAKVQSLGLRLVRSLTRQLGGVVNLAAGAEARCTITFPHTSKRRESEPS